MPGVLKTTPYSTHCIHGEKRMDCGVSVLLNSPWLLQQSLKKKDLGGSDREGKDILGGAQGESTVRGGTGKCR